MRLFIQVVNGLPVNHPAAESNLLEAFGEIPTDWEFFIRIPCPTLGPYEILDAIDPIYQKIDGVWQDVWLLREMTDQEKLQTQQFVKDIWYSQPWADNYKMWIFDEISCSFVPPVPYPKDAGEIYWCGIRNQWEPRPPMPIDNNKWIFDYNLWQWKEEF